MGPIRPPTPSIASPTAPVERHRGEHQQRERRDAERGGEGDDGDPEQAKRPQHAAKARQCLVRAPYASRKREA